MQLTSTLLIASVLFASVVGHWTTTADNIDATQTVCFATIGAATETFYVSANGDAPTGYQCFQVYPDGDSVVANPLPYESSSPSTKKGIKVAWPIVFSLVGLAAIIGGVFIFMRLRKHHIAKANHKWVNRPGGWAQDGTMTEEGTDINNSRRRTAMEDKQRETSPV